MLHAHQLKVSGVVEIHAENAREVGTESNGAGWSGSGSGVGVGVGLVRWGREEEGSDGLDTGEKHTRTCTHSHNHTPHANTNTYIHTNIHTNTYTHTRTHTHARTQHAEHGVGHQQLVSRRVQAKGHEFLATAETQERNDREMDDRGMMEG